MVLMAVVLIFFFPLLFFTPIIFSNIHILVDLVIFWFLDFGWVMIWWCFRFSDCGLVAILIFRFWFGGDFWDTDSNIFFNLKTEQQIEDNFVKRKWIMGCCCLVVFWFDFWELSLMILVDGVAKRDSYVSRTGFLQTHASHKRWFLYHLIWLQSHRTLLDF